MTDLEIVTAILTIAGVPYEERALGDYYRQIWVEGPMRLISSRFKFSAIPVRFTLEFDEHGTFVQPYGVG